MRQFNDEDNTENVYKYFDIDRLVLCNEYVEVYKY